jgi:hypothetical protein
VKRYRGSLALTVTAGAVCLVLVAIGAPWAQSALFGAGLFLLAGVAALSFQVVTDPAVARPGARWLHPAAGLAVLGLAVVAATVDGAGPTLPFLLGLLALTFGQVAWILRIGRDSVRGPADRLGRLAMIVAIAAPTLVPAIWIVAAIAIEGDLAWNGAPFAVPGLIVLPFAILAARSTVASRAERGA